MTTESEKGKSLSMEETQRLLRAKNPVPFKMPTNPIEWAAMRPPKNVLTDEQIKYMVNRFLSWRLPDNFSPDAGISFKAAFNEHTAYPMKHEPVGTNLFDAGQAEQMVRYLIEGMPASETERRLRAAREEAERDAKRYRWLRSCLVTAEYLETGKVCLSGDHEGLDELIDAALSARQGGEG